MLLALIKLINILVELIFYLYASLMFIWNFNSPKKKQFIKNLESNLGRTKRKANIEYFSYLHCSFRNNYYYKLMRILPFSLRNKFIDSIVSINTSEKVKECISSDKPILMSCLHHGFFFIGSKLTSDLIKAHNKNRKLGIFFDSVENTPSNKLHMDFQESLELDLDIFHNNKKHLIQSIKMLRGGGVVTMFNDVSFKDGAFIYTELMGKFHVSMSGSAFLQSKSDAVVIHPKFVLSCNRLNVEFTSMLESSEFTDKSILSINNLITEQYKNTITETPYLWHYTHTLHTMGGPNVPKDTAEIKKFLNAVATEDSKYFDLCKNLIKQLD